MRIVLTLMAFLAISGGRANAEEFDVNSLYRAVAVVTGTGEPNRMLGYRLTMEDVIVRVSGDYRLITSGKAAPIIDDAVSYVASYKYRDRYEGIPIHDEQGSHDRPHDLTVDFDRPALDAALASLGSKPWLSPRPRLAIMLAVKNTTTSFVLSADAERGSYMRDSFALASARIAIPISFVPTATLDAAGLDTGKIAGADLASLEPVTKASGGDQALVGTLTWSDADLGWIAEWRLDFQGKEHHWRISGVSFDDAFRNALRGAAQVLSGNGEPES